MGDYKTDLLGETMEESAILHSKLMGILFGANVLVVAIHGQLLRRILQELNPGIWEQADEMLTVFNATRNTEGH